MAQKEQHRAGKEARATRDQLAKVRANLGPGVTLAADGGGQTELALQASRQQQQHAVAQAADLTAQLAQAQKQAGAARKETLRLQHEVGAYVCMGRCAWSFI